MQLIFGQLVIHKIFSLKILLGKLWCASIGKQYTCIQLHWTLAYDNSLILQATVSEIVLKMVMNVASSLKLTTLFNPQCMILRVILKCGLLDQISLDEMDAIFSYVSIAKKQTYLNLIHGTSLELRITHTLLRTKQQCMHTTLFQIQNYVLYFSSLVIQVF